MDPFDGTLVLQLCTVRTINKDEFKLDPLRAVANALDNAKNTFSQHVLNELNYLVELKERYIEDKASTSH